MVFDILSIHGQYPAPRRQGITRAELREFIFDNDEPGEDRPFLSSPLSDLDDIDYA